MKVYIIALALLLGLVPQMAYSQNSWSEGQKVILITGTASGMGKAFAEQLIKDGHIVYGGDIQHKKNEYLNTIGGHALKMDVTKKGQVNRGVKRIVKEQGRIDVLINNAGYGLFSPVEEVSMRDAKEQFDVNLFGVARLTKAVLPYMREQKMGRIINISSVGGKVYTSLGAWYHATKHALEGWSDCLRVEVSELGIDVVIVEPGIINTNFYNVVNEFIEKYAANSNYEHMFKRFKEANFDFSAMTLPEEIAVLMSEIVQTNEPQTRYLKGYLAEMLIKFREEHGDRAYDDLLLKGILGI